MKLHLLITLVRSSECFRFIESLRTCIMASHLHPIIPELDSQAKTKVPDDLDLVFDSSLIPIEQLPLLPEELSH